MSSDRGFRHVPLNDDEVNNAAAIRRTRKNRRKTALKFILCGTVLLVVGVCLALIIYFIVSNDNSSDTCQSDVLAYCVDDDYNPCDDFYRYSCGSWLADNPLNGRSSISSFSDLFVDNYRHLRTDLSRSVQDSDATAIKKSKYIYSSCTNVDYIRKNGLTHIRDFIRDAGGWSGIGISDEGWSINSDLVNDHFLGSSAFFSFYIAPDDQNSSLPAIRITQAGLSLSSPQAYSTSDYDDLIDTIAAVLDSLDSSTSHNTLASNIASFEKSLAAIWLTDTELRNVSAQYNPMTLGKLQAKFNMDWVGYFNTFFHKARVTLTMPFTMNTIVIVDTPTYFSGLQQLRSHSGFSDYARWQLLSNEYVYSTASLQNSWTIMHERRFPKSYKLSESASFACVELTESGMPFAVARPFVDELINNNTIDKVNKTIDDIETAFLDNLMDKDWLDDATKQSCVDKVEAITRQVAYPDFIKVDEKLDQFYEDLRITSSMDHFEIGAALREFEFYQQLSMYTKPTDKSQWLAPPTQVNAYYAPQFNQFVFLAGILRSPFFASSYSNFRLYGGLGAVIGHELTHGFDDQGQQYNKDGNRFQWWTDYSVANFKSRTECFVDQYNRYSIQGHQIDGELTLGENIADNGGVRSAFQAFKNVMNGSIDKPLIDGHTPEQLFFVAFAQLWCSKTSDDYLDTSIATDPHSPGEYRTIGSLVNNEDFAAAFNCSIGSRMNPRNKCQLW